MRTVEDGEYRVVATMSMHQVAGLSLKYKCWSTERSNVMRSSRLAVLAWLSM